MDSHFVRSKDVAKVLRGYLKTTVADGNSKYMEVKRIAAKAGRSPRRVTIILGEEYEFCEFSTADAILTAVGEPCWYTFRDIEVITKQERLRIQNRNRKRRNRADRRKECSE